MYEKRVKLKRHAFSNNGRQVGKVPGSLVGEAVLLERVYMFYARIFHADMEKFTV
jgi:hypothetical protein